MAQFEITPNDYDELNETLAEKNIINTVSGKEYVVTSVESTNLDTRTLNPQTIDKMFYGQPYTNQTARYNSDLIVSSNVATAGIYSIETDRDWARCETLYYTGKYEFVTEEVITDENSLSCSVEIKYIKSMTETIDNLIYNVRNKTAFFDFGGQFPMLKEQGDDDLTTNEFIKAEKGSAIAQFLWAKAEAIAPMPSFIEYCTARVKSKTASSTTIEVTYRIKIWAGWSTDNQANNTILCVKDITINTMANTVDTSESDFSYQADLVNKERKYELETNELFQVNSTDLLQDRLSYQTYEQIIDKYDTDRRIISFTLLSPPKQVINDSVKYESGRTEERYIDVDDEFQIKDEHNNWVYDNKGNIATFKVIKSKVEWKGSMRKHITAIMLDV